MGRYLIWNISYQPEEYKDAGMAWLEYGMEFDFAAELRESLQKLPENDDIFVTVYSGAVPNDAMDALHCIQAIPIVVVLPPEYSAVQRMECVQHGAAQYIHSAGQRAVCDMSDKDDMWFCLDLSDQEWQPLTIITVKDLSFCLEYRAVEVRGQQIDLTAKEFEILALLITHQKRVFTYEMIMDLVWHEDYSYYSRKAINNHISNLRGKLKIAPDVPDYIKSVHSVGYKFSV